MCAYDCAQRSVHNTAQNSSDNLDSYLQTITIAQMLSIRGEGGLTLTLMKIAMNWLIVRQQTDTDIHVLLRPTDSYIDIIIK